MANSRNKLKRDRLAPKRDRFANLTGIRDFREKIAGKKKTRKCKAKSDFLGQLMQQQSEYKNKKTRKQEHRIQENKKTKKHEYRKKRIQNTRKQENKSTRKQEYKNTRLQEYKSTRIPLICSGSKNRYSTPHKICSS